MTATLNSTEIEGLRYTALLVEKVVAINLDGVTQEDSLVQPQPGGNCLNWVLGHLLSVYCDVLPAVKQQPVVDPDVLKKYSRGSAPLTESGEAFDLGELSAWWNEAVKRFDEGLASLTPEALDEKAPFSPNNNPNETVRSLLNTVLFHQAYHSGQTGLLRRIAGKPGAIK